MRKGITLLVVAALAFVACKKEPSPAPVATKCTKDADCTFSRKARGDCCVDPCGGSPKPVHVEEAAAITAYNASFCTPEVKGKCPQVECGRPPAWAPGVLRCHAGACTEIDQAKPAPAGT